MATKRVKMLLNLGTNDEVKYALPPAKADEIISVDERQENILVNVLKCAIPEAKLKEQAESGTTKAKAEAEPEHVESPVATATAHEAVGDISSMRSKEKLQSIVDNDTRETVREAARKRLAQL